MSPADDAIRQIDWRFLLPDPMPRVVAVTAAADARRVTDGFRRLGAEVVEVAEAVGGPGGHIDMVFVATAAPGAIRSGLGLRAPDGAIVVQTTSRRARLLVALRLRRARLDVRQYGCWPSCASATRYVPLDDRAALTTNARAAKNRRRRAVGTLLARWGLGSLLFREATLVATGHRGDCAGPFRVAFGDEVPGTLTLLTPRFGSSRHVIAMCSDARGGGLVVKTPRCPGDDVQIAREAIGLASVHGPRPSRPVLVADTERFGQRWLVQTRLDGLPLTRRDVADDPARWLVAAREWLDHMPVEPRSAPDEDGRSERLIRPALAVAAACADREPDLRRLVDDGAAAFDRVRSTPLPVVAEHGDFRPPNLLIGGPDAIGVVDWELAERCGLPFHDLAFFHAFVLEVAPHLRAEVRAHGSDALRSIGVAPDLFDALRSLAMLRQLANLIDRGTGTTATRAPAIARSDVARAWFADLDDRTEGQRRDDANTQVAP
ncbi:MAG TPA: aminoglycoside phosphotransferase family protein [Ilumatobacter sp.]|nr:aminoglycoside phosphotransferase family protein [Ilumatobacter sp.]